MHRKYLNQAQQVPKSGTASNKSGTYGRRTKFINLLKFIKINLQNRATIFSLFF